MNAYDLARTGPYRAMGDRVRARVEKRFGENWKTNYPPDVHRALVEAEVLHAVTENLGEVASDDALAIRLVSARACGLPEE